MDFYDAAGANLSSGVWWKSSVPNGTVTTQLGSRNYGVTFSGIERLDVTGTQFMDNLVGGEQADILRGGAGNDVLVGGGGNDTLEGGDGDDGFRAGVNSQQIDGGNGTDWLEIDLSGFAGGLVWANDPTQRVTLANGLTVSGIEVLALTTGAGDDEIRNTLVAAGDTITTGDGNDIIDAGGGNDTVNAGGGDDVIYQKDPGRDTVDGGTGDDLLVLDFSGEGADWYSPGYGIWMDFYDAAGANLSSGVWWEVIRAERDSHDPAWQPQLRGDFQRHRGGWM
ncbi:MAG: hypothetical protein IPJ27_16550 [Candidatus Accumulibacter sp.]|uniref:Calcium-binding protein n=1 Tax=Candidatus Accumulibacter proximus TaxID=2954385 RepID=A0A935UH06_9PROT|nr:hypothetical protein [Candidatus Accumulibacter proximus]